MLMTRFAGKIFEVPSPTAGPQAQLMGLPDMTGAAGEGRGGNEASTQLGKAFLKGLFEGKRTDR